MMTIRPTTLKGRQAHLSTVAVAGWLIGLLVALLILMDGALAARTPTMPSSLSPSLSAPVSGSRSLSITMQVSTSKSITPSLSSSTTTSHDDSSSRSRSRGSLSSSDTKSPSPQRSASPSTSRTRSSSNTLSTSAARSGSRSASGTSFVSVSASRRSQTPSWTRGSRTASRTLSLSCCDHSSTPSGSVVMRSRSRSSTWSLSRSPTFAATASVRSETISFSESPSFTSSRTSSGSRSASSTVSTEAASVSHSTSLSGTLSSTIQRFTVSMQNSPSVSPSALGMSVTRSRSSSPDASFSRLSFSTSSTAQRSAIPSPTISKFNSSSISVTRRRGRQLTHSLTPSSTKTPSSLGATESVSLRGVTHSLTTSESAGLRSRSASRSVEGTLSATRQSRSHSPSTHPSMSWSATKSPSRGTASRERSRSITPSVSTSSTLSKRTVTPSTSVTISFIMSGSNSATPMASRASLSPVTSQSQQLPLTHSVTKSSSRPFASATASPSRSSEVTDSQETSSTTRSGSQDILSASRSPSLTVSATRNSRSPTPSPSTTDSLTPSKLVGFTATKDRRRKLQSRSSSLSASVSFAADSASKSQSHWPMSQSSSPSQSWSPNPVTQSRSVSLSRLTPSRRLTRHSMTLTGSESLSQLRATGTKSWSRSSSAMRSSTNSRPSRSSSTSDSVTWSPSMTQTWSLSRFRSYSRTLSLSGSNSGPAASETRSASTSFADFSVTRSPSLLKTWTRQRGHQLRRSFSSTASNSLSDSPTGTATRSTSMSTSPSPSSLATQSSSLNQTKSRLPSPSASHPVSASWSETAKRTSSKTLTSTPSKASVTSSFPTATQQLSQDATTTHTIGSHTKTKYTKTPSHGTKSSSQLMTVSFESASAQSTMTTTVSASTSLTRLSFSTALSESATARTFTLLLSATPTRNETRSKSVTVTTTATLTPTTSMRSATAVVSASLTYNKATMTQGASATHSDLVSQTRIRASVTDVLTESQSITSSADSFSHFVSSSDSESPTVWSVTQPQSTSASPTCSSQKTLTPSGRTATRTSATSTPSEQHTDTRSLTVTTTLTTPKSETVSRSSSDSFSAEGMTMSATTSVTQSLTFTVKKQRANRWSSSISVSMSQVVSSTVSKSRHRTVSRRISPSLSVPLMSATRTVNCTATPTVSYTLTMTASDTLTLSEPFSGSPSSSTTMSMDSFTAQHTATTTANHTASPSWSRAVSYSPSLSQVTQTLSVRSVTPRLVLTLSFTLSARRTMSQQTVTSSNTVSEQQTVSLSPPVTPSLTTTSTWTLLLTDMISVSRSTSLTMSRNRRFGSRSPTQRASHSSSGTVTVTTTRTPTSQTTGTSSSSDSVNASMTRAVASASRTLTDVITATSSRSLQTSWTGTVTLSLPSQTIIHTVSLVPTRTQAPSLEFTATETSSLDSGTRARTQTVSSNRSLTETYVPLSVSTSVVASLSSSHSRTPSTQPSATSSATKSSSVTTLLTQTMTTTMSLSASESSDVTLSGSETPSRTTVRTPSITVSSAVSASKSRSRSIQGFSSVVTVQVRTAARIFPILDTIELTLANVPTSVSFSNDRGWLVANAADAAGATITTNGCSSWVQNATRSFPVALQRLTTDANGTLTLSISGTARRPGIYGLCYFASFRQQWNWWNASVVFGPKFRPVTFIRPLGRLTSMADFTMTVGVFGALPSDHIALAARSRRNLSSSDPPQSACPSSPSQIGSLDGVVWLVNRPVVTNVSLTMRGSMLLSGDFVVCYFGFPYTEYRAAIDFVRVAGTVISSSASQEVASQPVVAYQRWTVVVNGAGLSLRDQLIVTNGSTCTSPRLPAGDLIRWASSGSSASSGIANGYGAQSSIAFTVAILVPLSNASLCYKSNVSTYYTKLSLGTFSVLDNTPASISPSASSQGNPNVPLMFAAGSRIADVTFTALPNGYLNGQWDSVRLCNGNLTRCDGCGVVSRSLEAYTGAAGATGSGTSWRLADPLQLSLPQALLNATTPTTEAWSMCYFTNASRPWITQPLQVVQITQYPTEPQVFAPVAVTASVSFHVTSFNFTAANTEARVYPPGASPFGCTKGGDLTSDVISMSVATALIQGIQRLRVTAVPAKVQPFEVCFFHAWSNSTVISNIISVVPTAPSSFSPTRFIVNQSTDVTFFPSDGTVFNFAATTATVKMCPNVSETSHVSLTIDAIINASTLRLRFSNVTALDAVIGPGVLCFFDPRNGSLIPILLASTSFAVRSKLLGGTLSRASVNGVLSILDSALTVGPTAGSTYASSVRVTITGIALYANDLSVQACGGITGVSLAMVNIRATASTAVDVVTLVYDVRSTTSGAFQLCVLNGESWDLGSSASPLYTYGASTVVTVVFDTQTLGVQQMPQAPHPVLVDPAAFYWLISPNTSDSGYRVSAVKVVQYLSSLDNGTLCSNPVSVSLTSASSSGGTIWRYGSAITFPRGLVAICYQSYSGTWYNTRALLPRSASGFSMQAVFSAYTSTIAQDLDTASQTNLYATCGASVIVSGLQLDPTVDSFYYYATSTASATEESCTAANVTAVPISATQRDASDLSRLVNVTGVITAPAVGRLAICGVLASAVGASSSSTPELVGYFTFLNPIRVTETAAPSGRNVTRIDRICQSTAVKAAPSIVKHQISIRWPQSTVFLPLDDPNVVSSAVMYNTPLAPFQVRFASYLAASGATLSSLDTTLAVSNAAAEWSRSTSTRLTYCSNFNGTQLLSDVSTNTAAFRFAAAVVALSNFDVVQCAAFQRDGTLPSGNGGAPLVAATTSLVTASSTSYLLWDGPFYYQLLSNVTLSSLPQSGSSNFGASVEAATTILVTLLSAANPASALSSGTPLSIVVQSSLALVRAAAVFTSSTMSGSTANTIAPLAVGLIQQLVTLSCQSATSTVTTTTTVYKAGDEVNLAVSNIATRSESASVTVASSFTVHFPRQAASTSSAQAKCVGVASFPNMIPSTVSSSTSQRRSLVEAATTSLLEFNVSTIVVFSDSPISSFQIAWASSGRTRVDAFTGYRFIGGPNASSPTLESLNGGAWEPFTDDTTFTFDAGQALLTVNSTSSKERVGLEYLIASGIAMSIIPDEILAKRVEATHDVRRSIYAALLAVICVHIAGVACAVVYDRYEAAQRFQEAKELVFGLPSPAPTFAQIHRYTSIVTHNIVSLLPEEYLRVKQDAAMTTDDDPAAARRRIGSGISVMTLHPLAVVSTVSKWNAVAVSWYCLLLSTSFTNRDDIGQQIPLLWDDCVLMGGVAAVLHRPFVTWSTMALRRLGQDIPALIASCVSVGVMIVAGGAGKLDVQSFVVAMIVSGVAIYALTVGLYHLKQSAGSPNRNKATGPTDHQTEGTADLRGRRDDDSGDHHRSSWRWSLHHLMEMPLIVRWVGVAVFASAFILCCALLFFTPYFADKDVVFSYHPPESVAHSSSSFPFLGRGNPYALPSSSTFTPDTSVFWKSFLLAVVFDAVVLETFIALGCVWMMRVVFWWRVGRWQPKKSSLDLFQRVLSSRTKAPTTKRQIEPFDDGAEAKTPGGDSGDFETQFVDVFSGSPVATSVDDTYEEEEEVWEGRKSEMDTYRSPYDKGPAAQDATNRWKEATKTRSFTTFHPSGGGLIEEISDGESLAGTFVSVDPSDGNLSEVDSISVGEKPMDRRPFGDERGPERADAAFGEMHHSDDEDDLYADQRNSSHSVARPATGDEANPLQDRSVWDWSEERPRRQIPSLYRRGGPWGAHTLRLQRHSTDVREAPTASPQTRRPGVSLMRK